MADELHELKDRLADLSSAVDELLARQRAQAEADQPDEQPGEEPGDPPPAH